jgi:hypothetical protein
MYAARFGALRRMECNVLRLLLAALILMSAPVVGTAAGDARENAAPARCTRQNSQEASVPQIAADPEKYVGHCVAIEGVMQRMFLFESVDGVYLQPPDPINPASGGFRLGMDNISRYFSERYRHVSVLGRVQDCESVRAAVAAAESGFAMVSGYCHYFNGPYLYAKSVQFRSGRPFERRMGAFNRKDYGDLEPAPGDWPHRARVEALASEFLRALRSKDRERLAGIHFRDVGLEWKDEEAELLRFLLRSGSSPFASIRTSQAPPQQIIMVERYRLYPTQEESLSPDEVADYGAIVCFCREESCTGRWPMATFDADNIPARPYACTQVDRYLDDGRWVPHFTTRIGKGGLAEPRGRQ